MRLSAEGQGEVSDQDKETCDSATPDQLSLNLD